MNVMNKSNDMQTTKQLLGKRIKELREKRGLTQQELAAMIGIDQRNLSKIECGVTFPSKCVAALSKALDVQLPLIFDFNHIGLSMQEKRDSIKHMLDSLNDDNIDTIYRLVQVMYQ